MNLVRRNSVLYSVFGDGIKKSVSIRKASVSKVCGAICFILSYFCAGRILIGLVTTEIVFFF